MKGVCVTVQPIFESGTDQWTGESDLPFSVKIVYGPDDEQEVTSMYDGSVHFVSVDVPLSAHVEVVQE